MIQAVIFRQRKLMINIRLNLNPGCIDLMSYIFSKKKREMVRSLWQMIQYTVDHLLNKVTLQDIMSSEETTGQLLNKMIGN